MSLLEDVKKNLSEWYAVTSEKTTEVARVTSRRYDKWGVSRDIERHFSELGSLIYQGLQQERAELLSEAGVLALVERISGLEAELEAKNEEIETIRQQYAAKKPQAGPERGVSATVITDPVLNAGGPDSPILLDNEDDEHSWDSNQDSSPPKI